MKSLTILALLTAPAFGADQQTKDEPPSGDVVVTARSDGASAALRNCLNRKCPPAEDIAATLQVAAEQFTAGDYRASRETLRASRNRNGRFAKDHPVEVSHLHSALAVVSTHLGDGKGAWSGRLDELSALKAGLPKDDPRVLIGRLDLAEGYVFGGRADAALDEYANVAEQAHKLNLPTVEGAALLRRAQVLVVLSERRKSYRQEAGIALAKLTGRTDPVLAPYVTAARSLQVSFSEPRVSSAQDRAIAALRPAGRTQRPQLLYQPQIDFNLGTSTPVDGDRINNETNVATFSNDLLNLPMANFDKQWIDIAFDIRPDGRVADVKISRQSAALSGDWGKTIMASIAARRYAPMRIVNGDRVPRLERYTFNSIMTTNTRSRIPIRSSRPRIMVVDLSSTLPSGT